MTVELATPTVLGFLLGTVRAVAWLFVVPPFAGKGIPPVVRLIIACALALPVTPQLAATAPEMTLTAVVSSVVMQVVAGVSLGFLTFLLFSAIQAAGDLIDLFGGFQLAQGYDPMSNSQNSVFGKIHHMLAVALLFAIDGHLLVVRGFLRTFETLPLDGSLPMDRFVRILTDGLGSFFLAALQIAAPLIGVLFLVDIALGLLTRIAPALNPFQIGFPAKILATLMLVGVMIPLLPQAVQSVIDLAVRATSAAAGG